MGRIKCWKIKKIICPESKRTITFKKPLQILVEKIKRKWWVFRCVELPVIWDYAQHKKECMKYLTSLIFSLHDLYKEGFQETDVNYSSSEKFKAAIESFENAPE